MPGEEMDISTDFGHHDNLEDIDIDVDLLAGHQDDDLELGDYDQSEVFQHFNSDNKDELMAEEVGISFGMTGTDEITYDGSALANDYDIDIGAGDENTWQDGPLMFDSIDEITEDAQEAQHTGSGQPSQSHALSSAVPAGDPISHDYPPESSTWPDIDPESAGELHINLNQDDEAEDNTLQHTNLSTGGVGPDQSTSGEHSEGTIADEQPDVANTHSNDIGGFQTSAAAAALEDGENGGYRNAQHDDEISYNEADDDVPVSKSLSTQDQQQFDSPEISEEHATNFEGDRDWAQGDVQPTTQPAGSVHSLNADVSEQNDAEANEEDHQSAPTVSSDGDGEQAVSEEDNEHLDFDEAPVSKSSSEDEMSIISRHQIIVHYGESDYRLFAELPEDSPNQYFLKETSALDLPLGQLLSEIRGVVSEEVSPLDELVMHVDGLGLEFAESTTSSFLEEYTFRQILALYDSLVKNESQGVAIEKSELYIHLMVRPSCLQRLLALQVQASSGKSLTDVAVYRDTTPAQISDDDIEKEASHIAADYSQEDDFYDDDDDEQFGAEDGNAEVENTEQNSEQDTVHNIESTRFEGSSKDEQDENSPQFNESAPVSNGDDDEDDLLDYDNPDLSPSKQIAADFPTDAGQTSTHTQHDSNTKAATPVEDGKRTTDIGSQSTSATVTLDGDNQDEINFDGNDFSSNDNIGTSKIIPAAASQLMPLAEEEIGWESENDDPQRPDPATSQSSEQVSTTPAKRARSGSDMIAVADDRKDVKRQRS